MKKFILLFLSISLVIFNVTAIAAEGKITVRLNGDVLEFADQEPVIIDGRTMVPFRAIAEKLGCIVEWYPEMQEVYVAHGENGKAEIVVFAIGQQQIRVVEYFNTERGLDQKLEEMRTDVPPAIVNDRTVIPLRALADSMGADVNWDDATKTVDIQLDNSGFVSADDDECISFLNNSFYKVNYIYVTDEQTADSVARLAYSGSDFNVLAETYSEDENSEYIYTDGEMIPEFEDAVKNLSAGEVTQRPVESQIGYYIVKRLGFDKNEDSSIIEDIRLTVLFINSGLDVE